LLLLIACDAGAAPPAAPDPPVRAAGFVLALNTTVVAATIGQTHLYFSALLTLVLKVLLLP
jgi:hypothetical protein